MAANLNITYDDIGDILYLEAVKPYPKQETKHLGPDVLGRLNPRTGAIENIEILFFTERAKKARGLVLPVFAKMRASGRSTTRPTRRAQGRSRRK